MPHVTPLSTTEISVRTNAIVTAIGMFLFVFLAGCTQQIRPTSRTQQLGTERVFSKNYQIGQELTAFVGQPIIKVKDYNVTRIRSNNLRPSKAFVFSGGGITMTGDTKSVYSLDGETTIGGVTYSVVKIPISGKTKRLGVLVNDDGSVHDKVLNDNVLVIYKFTMVPSDVRFLSSVEENAVANSGYVNYELIYGGTDGKSITINYREFTSKDLARPAFNQNLMYEAGKSQIRFKDTVIQIHEATNERITFVVVSDGLN